MISPGSMDNSTAISRSARRDRQESSRASGSSRMLRLLASPFAGWSYYRRSFAFARPYTRLLILGFFITLILFLISLVPPLFTQVLLDTIIVQRNVELLNRIFLVVIGVFFLDLGLGFLNYWLFVNLSERLQMEVRVHFLHRLKNLSLRVLDKFQAGGLSYRLFSDTAAIPGAVSGMVVDFFLYLLTFIIVGAILLFYQTRLALFCFTLIPIHIATLIFFHKPVRRWSERLRRESESVSGDIIEQFGATRLIRSLGTEEVEHQRLASRLDTLRQWGVRSSLLGKSSTLAANTIANFWSFFVLWYGGHQVIQGAMTPGELVAFLMFLLRLLAPVSGITYLLLGFQDTIVGIRRVYEVLDASPDVIETKDALELKQVEGRIEFQNVSFEYDAGDEVLHRLSFEVKPGERVALVGRSGAGKTTVANLLARFYEPTHGQILIDGVDIRRIRLNCLRSMMGLVLQQDFLFSGTISDNIVCRMEGVSREEVLAAAQAAYVDEFARKLPQGYDTLVGERGVRLSGGQRQRIAIARVLLRNPRILILDEAMSAVDLESEAYIQEAIRRVMVNRTTLVIAHRLSTIRSADRIMLLDNGRLIEEGSHQELIQAEGVYQEMWERMARL